jgi:hypothetical protein
MARTSRVRDLLQQLNLPANPGTAQFGPRLLAFEL